ncbi:MAG: Glu/Leu/Phe/Val dehydrogenase dimerization domain-containing protein [Rickettsiella sp.]|nr:Glu/Leu/Phe/Val dehydrogenase dimerization domain-containing protein [Rickettsiella sp.]
MLSNELLSYAKSLGFGEIYFKIDEANQLYAVIAIHSTKLGPALGGCRFIAYSSIDLAIHDALRLAQGMSYKAALANLPLGGGKTVLMRPKQIADRKTYFQSLGSFVNDLNGRYIIAMDSGVTTTDMDSIALKTPYVVTTSSQGNPAPYTALGVLRGIQAAVKFRFNRDSLKGLHIAIQGLGHVGYNLATRLHKEGVHLTVCDPNKKLANHCGKNLEANVIKSEDIYSVECDIFSPCALGAILNDESISQLKTMIVAGAANNQLAEPRHAKLLQEKGILYTPDYVINAGGLIYAYTEYRNGHKEFVQQKIHGIYDTLLEIFKQADDKNKLPHEVANSMAEIRLTSTSQAVLNSLIF